MAKHDLFNFPRTRVDGDFGENEAADQIRRIDDLLEETDRKGNLRYEWAADTLTSIRETLERTKRVSPAQIRAIDNIENARQ
jgi:hypothetical protein